MTLLGQISAWTCCGCMTELLHVSGCYLSVNWVWGAEISPGLFQSLVTHVQSESQEWAKHHMVLWKKKSLTSENIIKNNYHLNNQINTFLYKIMGALAKEVQMTFTKHLITKKKNPQYLHDCWDSEWLNHPLTYPPCTDAETGFSDDSDLMQGGRKKPQFWKQ